MLEFVFPGAAGARGIETEAVVVVVVVVGATAGLLSSWAQAIESAAMHAARVAVDRVR
jgi:hypothetical protein